MYIFIDESGDLGSDLSKKGTSKKFTLAMLVCDDLHVQRAIIQAVKKTIKRKLNLVTNKKRVQELKGSATTHQIKEYFFNLLPEKGWYIYSITADKEKLKSHLDKQSGKNKVYNFLTRELFTNLSPLKQSAHVSVIIDASKNSFERKDFNAYIKTHLEITFGLDVNIYITHENSQNNAGLQAIDLFCWGIQREKSGSPDQWFGLFKHKIVKELTYPEPILYDHLEYTLDF